MRCALQVTLQALLLQSGIKILVSLHACAHAGAYSPKCVQLMVLPWHLPRRWGIGAQLEGVAVSCTCARHERVRCECQSSQHSSSTHALVRAHQPPRLHGHVRCLVAVWASRVA